MIRYIVDLVVDITQLTCVRKSELLLVASESKEIDRD